MSRCRRILTCKDCGKKVKVNRYKGFSDDDYLCAKCRKKLKKKAVGQGDKNANL